MRRKTGTTLRGERLSTAGGGALTLSSGAPPDLPPAIRILMQAAAVPATRQYEYHDLITGASWPCC